MSPLCRRHRGTEITIWEIIFRLKSPKDRTSVFRIPKATDRPEMCKFFIFALIYFTEMHPLTLHTKIYQNNFCCSLK